jgi:hypothetical protein
LVGSPAHCIDFACSCITPQDYMLGSRASQVTFLVESLWLTVQRAVLPIDPVFNCVHIETMHG